jgi:adenine-specific DNA-methyltransferase
MKTKSFLNYNVDITKQDEAIEEFKQLSLDQQKKALVELLDKNQLYVNLSEINDKDFEISEEDKKLNSLFYNL